MALIVSKNGSKTIVNGRNVITPHFVKEDGVLYKVDKNLNDLIVTQEETAYKEYTESGIFFIELPSGVPLSEITYCLIGGGGSGGVTTYGRYAFKAYGYAGGGFAGEIKTGLLSDLPEINLDSFGVTIGSGGASGHIYDYQGVAGNAGGETRLGLLGEPALVTAVGGIGGTSIAYVSFTDSPTQIAATSYKGTDTIDTCLGTFTHGAISGSLVEGNTLTCGGEPGLADGTPGHHVLNKIPTAATRGAGGGGMSGYNSG